MSETPKPPPPRHVTPYTARGLADFLAGLQKLSQETGVVVHSHGSQMFLDHRGRDLDVRLNRDFAENEYVIEVPL